MNLDFEAKSNLHYTRLIPFRVSRVSGAHLRGFVTRRSILKPTTEMPELAHRPGKAVRFSIGSQASIPTSEAVIASLMRLLA